MGRFASIMASRSVPDPETSAAISTRRNVSHRFDQANANRYGLCHVLPATGSLWLSAKLLDDLDELRTRAVGVALVPQPLSPFVDTRA